MGKENEGTAARLGEKRDQGYWLLVFFIFDGWLAGTKIKLNTCKSLVNNLILKINVS